MSLCIIHKTSTTLYSCSMFNSMLFIHTMIIMPYQFDIFICLAHYMMTWSNGNIFRVTGPLCGEFTGPGEFRTQRPVTRSFDVFLICVWINGWVNNREAGDLRRHLGHFDVIVMMHSLNNTNTNTHFGGTAGPKDTTLYLLKQGFHVTSWPPL